MFLVLTWSTLNCLRYFETELVTERSLSLCHLLFKKILIKEKKQLSLSGDYIVAHTRNLYRNFSISLSMWNVKWTSFLPAEVCVINSVCCLSLCELSEK